MTHDPREALEAERAELIAKIEADTPWGRADGRTRGRIIQREERIRAIDRELSALTASPGEQEPVAHRIRVVDGSYCKVIPDGELEIWKQNWSTHLKSGHALLEPLYLSPPAESNASVEARLREAFLTWINKQIEATAAQQKNAYATRNDRVGEKRHAVQCALWETKRKFEELSAVGDEAKKSEGGVEGHASVTSTAALNETSDLSASRAESAPRDVSVPAGIKPGPSSPTAERREIVARIIEERAVQIHIREHSCPPDVTNKTHRWAMHRIRQELNTFADAILAALDGGTGA